MRDESTGLTPLPLQLSDIVNLACDRFERELRECKQPQIESFLDEVPEDGRLQLLKELVGLEADYVTRDGCPLDFSCYFKRFPEASGILRDLQAEFEVQAAVTPFASQIPDSPPADMAEHSQIEYFTLRSRIGSGGFGQVWRAYDSRLNREIALKIPHAHRAWNCDGSAVMREAQASAALRHPNIVTVHGVGDGSETEPSYIVTELIEGVDLKKHLESNRLTFQQTASLIMKLAGALSYAHRSGIIHRDLKPANVLLDANGEPHLADFGLARRVSEAMTSNELAGTLPYMSPEQTVGAIVDARSDIYSLGVIMYELLVGKRPFVGDRASLMHQIQCDLPKPPRAISRRIPRDLENICLKCIEKNPQSRYQSAHLLAEDLELHLDERVPRNVSVPAGLRVRRWIQRNRRAIAMFSVASTTTLSLALAFWSYVRPVSEQRLVEFATDPPGCSIIVTRIDSQTGDPDPSKMEYALGLTPVKMKLSPGDYMVTAILNDKRFHEVPRHVPSYNEREKMAYRSRLWTLDKTGCVLLPEIDIPSSLPEGLVKLDGSNSWTIPGPGNQAFSVPPLLIEPSEHLTDLKDHDFLAAQAFAEANGMRLPTSLELTYVMQRCLGSNNTLSIHGLFTLPPEWTTSKTQNDLRILLAGEAPLVRHGGQMTLFPPHTSPDEGRSSFGIRCVRSTTPRTKPSDFIRSVDSPR